ncbi:hypothetical protein [Aestuariivirga sp.]|uniref:hypothetical protein n=1 Tax=Aestuariivirga sp. TaxID=2650926 RepID=UPI003BACF2DA
MAHPERLYPASIAFLMEERPLLWYEDAEQYDGLLRDILAELSPRGVIECTLVKNLSDYIWELRRMKGLKHTAINFVMPEAAARLLTSKQHDMIADDPSVREQAADIAYGAEERVAAGRLSLAARMREMRVTPEMIHYDALGSAEGRLDRITRECERLESRLNSLLKDFEMRRMTLGAMARSLVDRERAEVVEYREAS